MNPRYWIRITDAGAWLNGNRLTTSQRGAQLLRELYKTRLGNYPKFFKMDPLCRLGYVASELLLATRSPRPHDCDDVAVVMLNTTASLADDVAYQATIQDADNYFPSPAVFVYTLPNIVTGEICIVNKFYGESNFLVVPEWDANVMCDSATQALLDPATHTVLLGWLDCTDADHFSAMMTLLTADDLCALRPAALDDLMKITELTNNT